MYINMRHGFLSNSFTSYVFVHLLDCLECLAHCWIEVVTWNILIWSLTLMWVFLKFQQYAWLLYVLNIMFPPVPSLLRFLKIIMNWFFNICVFWITEIIIKIILISVSKDFRILSEITLLLLRWTQLKCKCYWIWFPAIFFRMFCCSAHKWNVSYFSFLNVFPDPNITLGLKSS